MLSKCKGSQRIAKDLEGPPRVSKDRLLCKIIVCTPDRPPLAAVFRVDLRSIRGRFWDSVVDARSIWGRFGIDSGPIPGRFGGGGARACWYLRRCFPVSPWCLRRCFSVSPWCLRRCFFVSLGRAGWPTTRARNTDWNIKNEQNHNQYSQWVRR